VKSLDNLEGLNMMIAKEDGRVSCFEQYDNVISYDQDKIKIGVPDLK
jgi:hypothetical protein